MSKLHSHFFSLFFKITPTHKMEIKIPEDGMKPDIYFFFALENGVPFMPFSLPLKSPCSSKSIDISSRDKSNKYWRMYLCWWHNDYLPVVISSYYFSPDQWISLNCCTSCVDHILGLFVPHSSLVSVFFFSASRSLRFVRLTFFVLNLFWTVQQT